ncbi:MAG TPA: GNAT family N-acetyltransferase [Candidatus Accumulibacter phosphatis]|nr:GNAT family N-acetyltransferase [Candidatus Accumulibacter phosphatis]HRQ95797.1 GNAT family N-acetyltransferase [Candidatus Accumulibacter phosphatis]
MSPSLALAWQNLPAAALQQNSTLSADWDRLNTLRADLPFLRAEAIIAALESFGTGKERLLVGRQGQVISAMFLLVRNSTAEWQSFQPSQLPLGAWVADPGLPVLDLARSLIRRPLGFCLLLSITQIDPQHVARPGDTADSQSSDYIRTAWTELQGSFAEYWGQRGKNLRQNMRKQRNRLAAEGISGRMRVLDQAPDMAAAIERYGALESAGWKAGRGTAIHPDNAQGKFYRRLLEGAAQRGEAVVFEYLFDDRVVASNLCLRRQEALVILKTTYDESIQSYSPAFLLSQDEIEGLYHEGRIRRIEYYGRMMEWHSRWTEESRVLYHLTLYRWPLLRQLAEWRRRRQKPSDNPPGG